MAMPARCMAAPSPSVCVCVNERQIVKRFVCSGRNSQYSLLTKIQSTGIDTSVWGTSRDATLHLVQGSIRTYPVFLGHGFGTHFVRKKKKNSTISKVIPLSCLLAKKKKLYPNTFLVYCIIPQRHHNPFSALAIKYTQTDNAQRHFGEKCMESREATFNCKTENAAIHKCVLNCGWHTVWFNIVLRTVASRGTS